MFTTGGRTQPVERPATQKTLGGPIAVGMTSELRSPRLVLWRQEDMPWRLSILPTRTYMMNLTSLSPSNTEQNSGVEIWT
jgi:hypothetical protein